MDFEKLAANLEKETGCTRKFTGDEEYPEYQLTFKIGAEREQDIFISPEKEEDFEFIRLISFIAPKSEFSDKKLVSLLDLNPSLRYGAFGIFQGKVALVDSAVYDSFVDEGRIIKQVEYMVKMADKFESSLVGLDKS